MPYSTRNGQLERAPGTGHSDIIRSQVVRQKLNSYEVRQPDPDDVPVESHTTSVESFRSERGWPPIETVVAVDGSPREVPINEEFPEDRIGYLQLAAVRVELEALQTQATRRFVDPGVVSSSTEVSQYVGVLPSSNVTSAEQPSTVASWRAEVDELFRTHEVEEQSLLSYFIEILARTDRLTDDGQFVLNQCPVCETSDQLLDPAEMGECESCGSTLYLTDSLRLYEKVNEQQSNIGALMQLMSVLEHFILFGVLLRLHETAPEQLARTALVHDGPLAVHQQPSWLHRPFTEVLAQVLAAQKAAGHAAPVVVGVEKNSKFVDHAMRIADRLPRESVLWMDDDYIYEYVLPSRQSSSGYGSRTYYGQRFVYQSSTGGTYVMTIPAVPTDGVPPHLPAAYPWFDRVVDTLEAMETTLYENALLPVVIAHQFASMPTEMGTTALRLFSKSELNR